MRTIALTSCLDELEHQITAEALEHAALDPDAELVACCGAEVRPASLAGAPGRTCRECATGAGAGTGTAVRRGRGR